MLARCADTLAELLEGHKLGNTDAMSWDASSLLLRAGLKVLVFLASLHNQQHCMTCTMLDSSHNANCQRLLLPACTLLLLAEVHHQPALLHVQCWLLERHWPWLPRTLCHSGLR